ncbi:ATP-grasp domain-containing protein [Blastococcus haudaquaticus]|uniref:Carbamoyl-phosphate synthase large subunit n=1 Tax=Blastococcus haudaquaticus TaxID=1938745 RepID=A0A286GXN7_9ACTN|nr:ATP-grasp domain-containing protein [Blastococcus haudaquaticus]SOE00252.1 carbamoyl-phosphate synthase large subunit [Blastococcus haudaquaticus]
MTRMPVPLPPVPRSPLDAQIPFHARPSRGAVLVTGSGGPAGIAVIRRLVAVGHRVVAADADGAAAGGALAQAAVTVPTADHPRFLDALLGAAAAYGADALIGTVAEELPALTAGVDRLTAAGVATWLPGLAAVDVCCDKAAFSTRMRAAGVPHPRTATRPEQVAQLPGPWIVKPNAGRGSRGLQLLDSGPDVVAALAADPGLIAQTRLSGREFTADALVDRDGRLVTVVPRWRDETKAGISVKGTTFSSEAVTDLVSAALAAVQLTGPANVQGFVADDGTATVVEINPRFSGGLPLTLAAGADVVSAYLAGIRDPQAELPFLWFTPGVRMSRYFAETYTGPDGSPVADPSSPLAVLA